MTYHYVGDKYWPGGYPPGDWCTGINEWGVLVISNAQSSKESPLPAGEGVSWCDMTQVPMERAKSAREAVNILGGLIDTYGVGGDFAESCWVCADQHEVWYLEGSLRHWVARKVRDKELLPICNRYVIGSDFDLASKDVVSYAVAQGWYDPSSHTKFSWKDVYGRPTTQSNPRFINREARIAELFGAKWGNITSKDCFAVARDHYAVDSPLYAYPPHMLGKNANKPLCSSSVCFSVVYSVKQKLPSDIGVMMWYAMAAPCSNVYMPIYAGTTELPDVYTMDLTSAADPTSAWWHFKTLMDDVDLNYAVRNPHVRAAWAEFESRQFTTTPMLEAVAARLYRHGNKANKAAALDLLTDYSNNQMMKAYDMAKTLDDWVIAQP